MMNLQIQVIDRYSVSAYDAAIARIYQNKDLQLCKNVSERLVFFSEQFLGKPYLQGALGEGVNACFDQSPLYRTNAFDCVTFINTVLALAISNNLSEFRDNLLRINYYDAEPKYHKRFHFMSVDWNLQNAKHKLVNDITTDICDPSDAHIYEVAVAQIDRPNWMRHRSFSDVKLLESISEEVAGKLLNKLHALSSHLRSEKSELPYLPFTRLFNDKEPNQAIFAQIPHGSVIEIVRPNWHLREKIGTNMNVSHVGFALRLNNDLIFRQASLQEKRVVDMLLVDYLRNVCFPISTIKGINVQKVLAG